MLLEFISRHSAEGTFTFVDQRVGGILGYTPSELLGHKCYQFFHPEDETHMRESFEQGNAISFNVVRTKIAQYVSKRNNNFLFSFEAERTGGFCDV